MAEIKSTMDIIMERTKNLTMTNEEKAAFRRQEAEGKVKGWIQKYQDGVIEIDTLRSDFENEQKEFPEVRQILKSQLMDCLRLNEDNGKILEILDDILGIRTSNIKNVIQSLRHGLDVQRTKRIESIRKELKKKKIYGSSVIPNPDHGGDWQKIILEAESELKKRLNSVAT
jgi:hypothetical protein